MNKFKLKIIWLEKSIAFALDEKVGEKINPITEYFFWPRTDAWEEFKVELEKKSWISKNECIDILNRTTEIINFWEEKKINKNIKAKEIEDKFPICTFIGHN
jgi:30S ribosomal protein 3